MHRLEATSLLAIAMVALSWTSTVESSNQPTQRPVQSYRYNRLELHVLSATSMLMGSDSASTGQHLTLIQVNECLQRLVDGCHSAGFDDVFRLAQSDRTPRSSSAETNPLEMERHLQQLLREVLFRAHRSDRPDDRLAVCLLVQTPNIFDQWRPRSDPICLTLQGVNFLPKTSAPEALSILCSPTATSYSQVFIVCSRSGPAGDEVAFSSGIRGSSEPSVVGHQQRPSLKGLAVAASADAGAISRIVCALVWTLTIALSIVAMLIAGTLLNSALRRRQVGRTNAIGAGGGIAENAEAPGSEEISSKGSLIVVTAAAAEIAGMSATIGLCECDCDNCDDSSPVDGIDFNYNEDDLGTLDSDSYARNRSVDSRL